MEFLVFPSILPYISLSLGFIISLVYFSKTKHGSSGDDLPPGKMGLPVVGEYLSFMFMGRKGKPERFILDRMNKHSDRVFKTSLLGGPTAVMCGAEGNRFLFSNDNKLVSVWFPQSIHRILPSSSSADALHMKKLLLRILLPENLQRYTAAVDKIAQSHFDVGWEGKQQLRVRPLARNYTFAVACKLFLSIDNPQQVASFEDSFDHVVAGIVSLPLNLPGMAFHRSIKAAKTIKTKLLGIITARKRALEDEGQEDDLLSHLLSNNMDRSFGDECVLSDVQIADRILAVLVASRDSAASTITFLIDYLAELPHIYQGVFRDYVLTTGYVEQMEIAASKGKDELLNWEDIRRMKFSWNVVREVLRLASPYQAAYREVLQGFQYAGYNIPKGWKVMWNTNSTHKNPQYFPNPEKFDPTRFDEKGPIPYTYVAFGGGSRMCPGKDYTQLEILVYLHNLIKRFKWKKLIPHEKIIVDPMPIHVEGFPIRISPLAP